MDSNLKLQKMVDIFINDTRLTPDIANAITELTIVQSFQKPSQCELQLVLSKEQYAQQVKNLLEQSDLEIKMADDNRALFLGVITAIVHHYGADGKFAVLITACDHLYLLSLTHPVQSFVDVTLVDIAQQMLSPYGISVNAEDPGPLWSNLVQYQSSSLEFLQDMSERSGLYFYLQDKVLNLVSLAVEEASVTLEYGSSLLEIKVNKQHLSDETQTVVSGWDPLRTKILMADSLQSSTEASVFLNQAEPEVSHQTSIVDQAAQSEQQLDILAQAQSLRINALKNQVSGLAEGNIDLHPGTDIELKGLLADDTEQQYRLTRVSHTFNPFSGYVSKFKTYPPLLNRRSRSTLVTYGIVSQIADPENLGRIKVILPTYNNIETNWLEVVIPGAGTDKGIIALPAIDDKVLLVMLHERIEQAIVLGGLYGEAGLPEEIIVDGEVSCYSILTPGGQGLRLNDQQESISLFNKAASCLELNKETAMISTQSGNHITMNNDSMIINSQTPLVLQAPGNTITIRASRINFEKANG